MRNEWFCSGPEGRTGPLTLDQLKRALARHPQAADVYIWHESFPEWVRAGDIGDLNQLDAPAPLGQRYTPAPFAQYDAPVPASFSQHHAPYDHGQHDHGPYDHSPYDQSPYDHSPYDQGAQGAYDHGAYNQSAYGQNTYGHGTYDPPFGPEGYDMSQQNYAPEENDARPVRRRFSVLGVLVGALVVAFGLVVAYLGLTGDFTLVSETFGFDAEEVDASAGLAFVIVGIVIIWVTRYKVRE
jgi:hypothetical protein